MNARRVTQIPRRSACWLATLTIFDDVTHTYLWGSRVARFTRSAWGLARLVADAWPVVVRGRLHPCAEQDPAAQPRSAGHPRWCSQGPGCQPARRFSDGSVEWDHSRRVDVVGEQGVADVFLVRMDALRADGLPYVDEALGLTAKGTFTADEAEGYALQILAAVQQLDAGLDGTPGGVGAALLPWPEPGRLRAV